MTNLFAGIKKMGFVGLLQNFTIAGMSERGLRRLKNHSIA
jgi:hypothetical protein